VVVCAVFELFSALGSAGGRSGSTMNRNPLPRGRAAESVDWLTELFKFLPPSSSSIGVASVRVPLTLVIRHSRPHTWYASGRRVGVREAPTSGDSDEIIARFLKQSAAASALVGLEGQVDVVAIYAATQKGGDKSGPPRSRTRTEYFDEGLLRDFLKYRPTKADGILQLFAIPTGSKSTCVRASFVGGRMQVETRTSCNFITDTRHTIIERASTFDGDEHVSRAGNVPASSALFSAVSRQMRDMVTHVEMCLGGAYIVGEATAYFRVHADTKLYFLFMPSLLLCHAATGAPANPQAMPQSPRVAKPVLAYAGSLPRDYFRCPCCGTVVAAAERAQVPYPMMLQHIQMLDESDGVADGDSAALRAIAQTLDKVGRNPKYYAALYRAAAKANPLDNTLHLLRACGYPGGDLELDDRLENPAELVCFRLLQLAVSSGTRKDPGLQFSIAHYKWVRDHRPELLQRIKIFVCTDCSLDVSNSAFDNQRKVFSQVGPGGGASEETPVNDGTAPTLGGMGSAATELSAVHGAAEELLEQPQSLTDNNMRKTMSLPLLKPKLDRTAAAQSRPWRQRGGNAGAHVSEAPRFDAIGSLKGEMPKPDPRYLPFLQARLDEKARKQRQLVLREGIVVPSFPSEGVSEEEDGGGTFLTAAAHVQPHRGGGRHYTRRLPQMDAARLGGEMPKIVLDHTNAITDVAAGQAALDAKIGHLHDRMAALEGTISPAKRAARKKALAAKKNAPEDKHTATA